MHGRVNADCNCNVFRVWLFRPSPISLSSFHVVIISATRGLVNVIFDFSVDTNDSIRYSLSMKHQGTKLVDDALWYEWQVMPRSVLPENLSACDILVLKDEMGPEYNRGPGRSFASRPSARVSRSRVLIKQRCGLDI